MVNIPLLISALVLGLLVACSAPQVSRDSTSSATPQRQEARQPSHSNSDIGQSQRIIFKEHPELDCIVHFHCPVKEEYKKHVS